MESFHSSLSDSETRKVEWSYTGKFLQMGTLQYTCPKTGKLSVILFTTQYYFIAI